MLSRLKQADIPAILILTVAFALRVYGLDIKAPHFDEGINGWFVDRMRSLGYYKYDPTNYHGPFYFYSLFASLSLFGRNLIALRIPAVLASLLSVWWMLRFANIFPKNVCRIAALLMAVSPAYVFYGRYSIHESSLLFFLLVTVWGILTFWKYRSRAGTWAAGLGLTGMILTKETYIIHAACLVLAGITLWLFEKGPGALEWVRAWRFQRHVRKQLAQPGRNCDSLSTRFRKLGALMERADYYLYDLTSVVAVGVLLIVLFYSGFFLYWPGVAGLFQTYSAWVETGLGNVHGKPWSYWLELMSHYELPALLGLAAAIRYLAPADRFVRYLAIYGTGCFVAYSIVQYKTPWCIMVILWPFYFIAPAFLVEAAKLGRSMKILWAALFIAMVQSIFACLELNFERYEDEDHPYVYVQTFGEIAEITRPLLAIAHKDPVNYHIPGHIIMESGFPLPWLLGDFSSLGYYQKDKRPSEFDAGLLVVDEDRIREVEVELRDSYYTRMVKVRNGMDPVKVYFRSSEFQELFPGIVPDIRPGSIPEGDIEVRRALPVR